MDSNKRRVYYVTPTQLSFLDLTTIGGSEKRGDETKIGKFCSGLKYALAILSRNGVEFTAKVSGSYIPQESRDRYYATFFTIGKEELHDVSTSKEYEVLTIQREIEYESFMSQHCFDDYAGDEELNEFDGETVTTGISTSFGEEWELWQAMREIHSNMLDEGGYLSLEPVSQPLDKQMTVICLEFEKESEFDKVFNSRDEYFLPYPELDYQVAENLSIGIGNEHLQIYKQGILVYEDEEVKTPFKFNISFGELDERRILHDPYSLKTRILEIIAGTDNTDLMEYLLTSDLTCDFLNNQIQSYYFSAEFVELANKLGEEGRLGKTLKSLMASLKMHEKCLLAGRGIRGKSVWYGESYNPDVRVESTVQEISEKLDKEEEISEIDKFLNKYPIEITVPIVKGKLVGSNTVYDKITNTFIVTDDFNSENEKDVMQFILNILTMDSGNKSSLEVVLRKYIELLCKK